MADACLFSWIFPLHLTRVCIELPALLVYSHCSSSLVGTLKRTMSLGRLTRKRSKAPAPPEEHNLWVIFLMVCAWCGTFPYALSGVWVSPILSSVCEFSLCSVSCVNFPCALCCVWVLFFALFRLWVLLMLCLVRFALTLLFGVCIDIRSGFQFLWKSRQCFLSRSLWCNSRICGPSIIVFKQ